MLFGLTVDKSQLTTPSEVIMLSC